MAMRHLIGAFRRAPLQYRGGGGRNTSGQLSNRGVLNIGSSPPAALRSSFYDRGCNGIDPFGSDMPSSPGCCSFHSYGVGLHPVLPNSSCASNNFQWGGAGVGVMTGGGVHGGGGGGGVPQMPSPYYPWQRHRSLPGCHMGIATDASLVAEEKTYARDVQEYNEVLYKLSRSKRAYLMRDVYEDMLMDGVRPNRDTYHLLIPACMKAHRLQDVMYFFSEMKSSGLVPDLVLFNCIISTCGRCFQVRRAFEVAEEMEALGIQPKLRTFVALLNACGTSGRVEEAYEVVKRMAAHGLTLNKYCYSALITAHKNRRPVNQDTFTNIFELLDQARAQMKMSADDDFVDSALGDDEEEMNEEIAWIQDVPAKRGLITHKAAVYNAALRACVDLRNHEAAMKVIDRIKEDGLKPDAYVFTHLIRSYLMQQDMDKAVGTFDKYMATGGHPSLDIFMIMIDGAIRRYKPETMELAKRLLRMMEEHGYFLNPKFGGQLLSLAAREHGGDFSTADMIWDMLDKQNRKPHFKAAFAYMQGLQNRGTLANDPRLLAVKSLVSPDLMRMQRQGGGSGGPGGGGGGNPGVVVVSGNIRPWMRGAAAVQRPGVSTSIKPMPAGTTGLGDIRAELNIDDSSAEESDDENTKNLFDEAPPYPVSDPSENNNHLGPL